MVEQNPRARSPEDDVSLSGLRALDARAFETAFSVFSPRLNGWLVRMGAPRAVAEELVQEAFVRLARSAPTLREDTRVGAWLFTVTRNLWVSHRRWCWLDGTRLMELADQALSRPVTPVEQAIGNEAASRVEKAVAALPEPQRAVFLLVALEGMEPTEAAGVLGIAPEAARQRLARARKSLKEALA